MKRFARWLTLTVTGASIVAGCASAKTPTPEAPTQAGPSAGDTWTRPADQAVMVYVPAGEFEMGSDEGQRDEDPVHTVALDAYWTDRTEVTNGQYRECVEAAACDPPAFEFSQTRHAWYGDSDYNDYPVVWVSRHQADAYCSWAVARQPVGMPMGQASCSTNGR